MSVKKYNNGYEAATGFSITAPEPFDDRLIVTTKNDLKTLPNCHKWIKVTTDDDGKEYKWNGNDQTDLANWIEVGSDNSSGGSSVVIVNNFTTGGTDKAASAETVKLLYEGKQTKEKVEIISSAGARTITNADDNTVFYLKSANIVFDIPNGLNDLSFNVSVRGANKPSYTFGSNYTTDPSDANDLDLIYNSSHYIRKIGNEIFFN